MARALEEYNYYREFNVNDVLIRAQGVFYFPRTLDANK